jgi:hypothetical protein
MHARIITDADLAALQPSDRSWTAKLLAAVDANKLVDQDGKTVAANDPGVIGYLLASNPVLDVPGLLLDTASASKDWPEAIVVGYWGVCAENGRALVAFVSKKLSVLAFRFADGVWAVYPELRLGLDGNFDLRAGGELAYGSFEDHVARTAVGMVRVVSSLVDGGRRRAA